MRFQTVFNNQGRFVYLVKKIEGDLDLDTGKRNIEYKFERVRALVGVRNFGFQMHLNLDESMIAIPKKADLVIVDQSVHKLVLLESAFGIYIYKKDVVTGNELRSILDVFNTEGCV